MAEWYAAGDAESLARVEAAWPAAPIHNQELLGYVLDVAREQVVEFASPEDPSERLVSLLAEIGTSPAAIASVLSVLAMAEPLPPVRLVLAQLQQAQNLWNAGSADGDGDIGPDGFRFTPRPLDKTIRQMIRPKRGVPDVF